MLYECYATVNMQCYRYFKTSSFKNAVKYNVVIVCVGHARLSQQLHIGKPTMSEINMP